ncbi:MAG: S1/P1 Nuclease, partial [Pseudomonadota bacterium]
VLISASQSDSVLSIEKSLSATYPDDKKYTYEEKGQNTIRTYSAEFCKAYNDAMNNMVERKMRSAIIDLGSIWYTCWVNAGSPDLQNLKDVPVTPEQEQELAKMQTLWKQGKIIGREEPSE